MCFEHQTQWQHVKSTTQCQEKTNSPKQECRSVKWIQNGENKCRLTTETYFFFKWMNEERDEWMNERMNEWMDGWTNEWMNEWRKNHNMLEINCLSTTCTTQVPSKWTSLVDFSFDVSQIIFSVSAEYNTSGSCLIRMCLNRNWPLPPKPHSIPAVFFCTT